MQGKLEKGMCTNSNKYWPSEAVMKRHRKCHRVNQVLLQLPSYVESMKTSDSKIGKSNNESIKTKKVSKQAFG